MRLIFAGTPDFAARALEALLAAGHRVMLVLTQPDRRAGRGMALQASAVKKVALAHGIPVFQPERLKDPATHGPIRAACVEHGAELMVVAAYGLILPQAVLDLPRRGCINIHASLLPRWRGAAPIQRAIEAGDAQTGITIMRMEAGLDTGPMLLAEAIDIDPQDSTGSLQERLAKLGGKLVVDALARFDQLVPVPQPAAGVSYANKIDKAEARLDWNQPAMLLARTLRAFNPFPGALVTLAGEPVKVWRGEVVTASGRPGEVLAAAATGIVVACGEGALRLTELQRSGGRRVASSGAGDTAMHDFLRGSSRKPD